jgi:hypothetical protein
VIDHITILRAAEAGLPAAESHPDPPLHCFPLRVDWERATGYVASVEPYPVPAAAGHLVGIEDWPPVMASLFGTACAFGWSANVTRAVGTMPHATHGTPTTEKESFAIRFARGSAHAVAVYRGGAWESMWTWSSDEFFTRRETLEAFMGAIMGEKMTLPSKTEWDKLLVKYPKRPTKKEWEAMREAGES